VTIVDANHDELPDLAFTHPAEASVSVALGTARGSFSATTRYEAGQEPSSLAFGDLDGNGSNDLITSDYQSFSVLSGRDGGFADPVNYPGITGEFSALDFDRDGLLDLAARGSNIDGYGGFRLLFGDGTGSFRCTARYAIGAELGAFGAGDLNSDGQTDVVTTTDDGVVVLLNSSDP
jgi:hypothetical protein